MKRLIVALSVPEDTDPHDLATEVDCMFTDADPTVWTLGQFFDDVADGLVERDRDGTMKQYEPQRQEA